MTKQNKGRKLFAVSASAALVASAIVPVASANAGFTDASKISSWAKEAVEYFVEQEVINGYEDGSFKPANSVKRGEAAKMFSVGLDLEADEESDLTDVSGHWAKEFINAVAANGIVNGYEDGSFKPEKTLTRAETAKMIVTALEFEGEGDISAFKDVAGHWAEEYIAIAVEAGILNGVSATQMAPDADVTREQFAAMLYRAFDAAGYLDVEVEPTLEEALEDLATAQADAEAIEEVDADNLEEAQEAADALEAAIEAVEAFDSEDEDVLAAVEAAKEVLAALQDAIAAVDGGEAGEGVVSQVSAINGTTVEVTFEEALESVNAADFSIEGLTIEKAEFKPESDNRVVVLTTSAQSVITYNLVYGDQSVPFIGKNALGTVMLKADKEQVTIDPNLNTLPTVDIQVELSSDFPEGAEAVIEFETSFGQVVKVQTTKGGKTSFTLTPEKTLFSQVARVTGKVVEVKNPTTGETYPEYRNATVNTVNVKFDVKTNNNEDAVEVFQFSTAYAEQADRVVLRVDGSGVSSKMAATLANSPQAKIAAFGHIEAQQNLTGNQEVEKEFYTLLHDVLFSNLQEIVDKANADYRAGRVNKSDALKQAETAINKFFEDLKVEELRNVLYVDTIHEDAAKNRYDEVYKAFGVTKTDLFNKIKSISDDELKGIVDYYKLLSKFIVLDNVRDTQAPQSPNAIYGFETIYAADNNTLVLVLPTDRSTDTRILDSVYDAQGKIVTDYRGYKQRDNVAADFLQDNVSHQVVFLNNIEKDRYQLTGAPTFKLEDANDVKLISVDANALRYKVADPQGTGGSNTAASYCPIPFGVDVSENYLSEGGSTSNTTEPKFTGASKVAAKNYTISDYFKKYDRNYAQGTDAQGNPIVDKLGEVLVVFSESVSLYDNPSTSRDESVLNPENWTVDGINLAQAAAAANAKVDIRLVSTDVKKQLRDGVIITFTSRDDGTKVINTDLIKKFIEAPVYGDAHKLEVSKLGDWASVTDAKNIVPTQTLDYTRTKDKTLWGAAGTGNVADNTSGVRPFLADTNAFVVRAAGQADITKGINVGATADNKDIVRILFSEPMLQSGSQSVLNKENYKLNGKELPVDGTSIKVGLEGVAGFQNSPCAVTIELPQGTLTKYGVDGSYDNSNGNDNIIAVSNVRGLDDNVILQSDLQLAYARNLTFVTSKSNIGFNGKTITADGNFVEQITYGSLRNVEKIEGRVYRDAAGNPIEFSNTWVNSANFFLTHPEGSAVVQPPTTGGAALSTYGATVVNNGLGEYVITVDAAKLPAGTSYSVTLGGVEYVLAKNVLDNTKYTVSVPTSVGTEAQVLATPVKVTGAAPAPSTTTVDALAGTVVNNGLGEFVVTIDKAKLTADLQGKSTYTLTVKGTNYTLANNILDNTKLTVSIPAAGLTEADVKAGTVAGN